MEIFIRKRFTLIISKKRNYYHYKFYGGIHWKQPFMIQLWTIGHFIYFSVL